MIVLLSKTKHGTVINAYDRITRQKGRRLKKFKGKGSWQSTYSWALTVTQPMHIEPPDAVSRQ